MGIIGSEGGKLKYFANANCTAATITLAFTFALMHFSRSVFNFLLHRGGKKIGDWHSHLPSFKLDIKLIQTLDQSSAQITDIALLELTLTITCLCSRKHTPGFCISHLVFKNKGAMDFGLACPRQKGEVTSLSAITYLPQLFLSFSPFDLSNQA